MTRWPHPLALLLAAPVVVGLVGVILPAFGYLPALGGTAFSLQPFRDLFAVPGLAASALLSLAAGLLTTLVSVGATLLFTAAFAGTRGFRLARRGLGPLLGVPHAAAAFGLAFLIAPSGLLVRLVSAPLGLTTPPDLLIVGDPMGLAMMAGLIVKELPFLLLVVIAALPQADPERGLKLARSLGYGRVAGFTLAVWPAVYRQIRLPVLAVAAFASSVVDVALILGPMTPAPLAVRLVEWMGDPDLSLRFQAAAGAVLQLGLTLAVLALWLGVERLGAFVCRRMAARGARFHRDRPMRRAAALPVALAFAATGLGLLLLALWSIAGLWTFPDILPPTLTLRSWRDSLTSLAAPLARTAVLGFGSALVALLLVVAMLEQRRRTHSGTGPARLSPGVAALLYLPLIVPQVAFIFGLQILVLAAGIAPSTGLLVAVHLVFVAPYVALALAAPWFALDPRYDRMAASLGRSRRAAFWRLRLPLLAGPILTALAIGFAVSAGQYLPTLLIGAGRLPTITTEAVALASGGNRRVIGVTAVLQTLLPGLVFLAASLLPALLHRGRRGMRA
ncbi:ABC transporter permease [Aureimonas sp. SA4125]|uniref:ABC transporter permease n=1 Tax=Aureimonas sp. SA4125 TaxID=2826993 RepID=UPI001CC3977D|nr:ABC transporter permease [Aureimonas sp. SA4125]BDA86953.1 ABC transporter permease [Aureimonas sp. SA4125]